jgi:NTE family protein
MTDIHWRPTGAETPRKLALALQGGGAHGALSWGMLDRILQDEDLEIVGLSGSGAGAVNAVVLADGLLHGGREGAREALRCMWDALADLPSFGTPLSVLSGELQAQTSLEVVPQYLAWDLMTRCFAPADLNPFGTHPMRAPLERLVDFERLRAEKDLKLMVSATDVLTGRRRVFANTELTVETVLASVCRPHIHPPVEVEGAALWEGGLAGGPALAEFIQGLPPCDLVLLRTEPVERPTIPRTPREIQDRALEIGSNTSAWLELSALAVVQRLTDEGWLDRGRFGRILLHSIEAGPAVEPVSGSTRLNYSEGFLAYLFDRGRMAVEDWLIAHRSDLGDRSTLDLQALLPVGPDAFKRSEPAYTISSASRSYAEAVRPRIKLYSPRP